MKNKLLCLFAPFLLILCNQTASAQWATSGANIYNTNTGNVGIGTSTPSNQLTLSGVPGRVASFGMDQPETVSLYAAFSGSRTFVGFNATTSNAVLQGGSSRGIEFNVNSSTFGSGQAMVIDNTGNVGVGSTTPLSHLWIEGTGTQSLSINSTQAGATGVARTLISLYGANSGGTKKELARIGAAPGYVTNAGQFIISTNNSSSVLTERMRIDDNGKVGIGTQNPDEALTVAGNIHTKEVLVDLNIPTPDYVFNSDYQLPTLAEVRAFINANHHLQDVPSAAEVDKNGLKLGQMNLVLLKKVEELTLYLLDKDEKEKENDIRLDQLKKFNDEAKQQNSKQQAQINELKNQLQQLIKNTSCKTID